MRMTWRKAKPKPEKKFRVNEQIKADRVFLIDEYGEQVGEIDINDALARAKDIELDLVEVNPNADPPVVKIVDFGKLKYEKDKLAHKQKVLQKKSEIKGIRMSVRISRHDLDVRIKQAEKFLLKGNKLKVEIVLRGRERQHPVKVREVVDNFIKELDSKEGLNIVKEQDLTKQGGRFSIVLVNKKS